MKQCSALIFAVFFVFSLILPCYGTDAEASPQPDVLADLSAYYDFEHRPLEDILSQFRTEYGLNESNFTMGYYATGTGDAYGFQVDSFRDAATTYMVPMNMIFYDQEADGTIQGTPDSDGNYYITTYFLPDLHLYTITGDDTAMSNTMVNYLGTFRESREALSQYSDQSYTEEFYTSNVLNARYMMNVLWRIYENKDTYKDLLEDMDQAQEGWGFDLKLENAYTVYHKFSQEDSVCNDVAIINTPQPFLLAAFSQNVGHAEEMLGALAELMTEYTLYLGERQAQGLPAYTQSAEAQSTETPEAIASAPQTDINNTAAVPAVGDEKEDGPVPVWVLILVIILAAALCFLCYRMGLVKGIEMERKRIRAAKKRKQKIG